MSEKISYADVWKFTWHYWSRQKAMLVVVFTGMMITAVTDAMFPMVTGWMIDAINEAGRTNGSLWNGVLPAFIVLLLIGVLYHSIRNGTVYFWNVFAVRNLYAIEDETFRRVQRFSSDWHANAFAGATVRKITRAKWAFDVYEDILFLNLFPSLVVLITIVIGMTMKAPLLGLVTIVSAVIYMGANIYMVMKVNAPHFRRSAERDTTVGAVMADSMSANMVVKSFGAERREDQTFQRTLKRWRMRALKSWQVSLLTDLVRRYMSEAMMGAMIGAAIYLWSIGRVTPGDVVYVLTSFILLSMYLRALGDNIMNMQRAITDMEDAIKFWMRDDEMLDREGAQPITVKDGRITFDAVRFTYTGKREPLFDNLTLKIKAGERIALVGHSGSGKSSFVKLLQRLYDVGAGEIRIDGENIAEVTQDSLRRNIALVQQEPVLFHRTIAANIAYGRPKASMAEIVQAAKQAYAHDFIADLSDGYGTLVGERGVKLSGGERQRVAIARAILADAPILILDEATASLDSVSEHYIQKAMDNLMKGKTTITVAHRLATIRNADRILVFEKGRIVEEGTHDSLIAKGAPAYKELYEMQALGEE